MASWALCQLCQESSLVPLLEVLPHHFYVDEMLQKLFEGQLVTSQLTHVCSECHRILKECYMLYEKISQVQTALFSMKCDGNEGKLKPEETNSGDGTFVDTKHLQEIKEEIFKDTCSDDDDSMEGGIFIVKLESSEDFSKPRKNKEKKIDSATPKKKPSKTWKQAEKSDSKVLKENSNSTSDPSMLIDSNGKFIVTGPKLEEMISKFYIMTCDVCDKKHIAIRELFHHYETQHNVKGYVTCCSTKMHIYRKIKFHMAMHVQPSAFNCGLCDKTVTRPSALKYHVLTHLPTAEKPLQCDQCGKGFVHKYHLEQHMNLHLPVDKRPFYQCKMCCKTFTVQKSYASHMSVMHKNPKYLCTECGRSFRDKQQFNNHMKTHEPESVRLSERVKCKICGVTLANVLGLQAHMKRHQSKIPCPYCKYVTCRNVELNRHIQVKHTDMKPFYCVACDKLFRSKQSLKVHMTSFHVTKT